MRPDVMLLRTTRVMAEYEIWEPLQYKYTNTQTHKYTNTAYYKVPERPTMWYIFEKRIVQGCQK